jgi:Cu(I)/Ag(I) efflux system membrane fusion protein
MNMKKKKIIIAIVVLAILGTGTYFIYAKWMYITNNKEIVGAKKDNADIDFYHCGMHPWITDDKPSKCPICGMILTPVYKNDAKNEKGIVQIDPAMVQNIGVKTEIVMKRKLTHTIRTTGRVDYDETKQTYITTKFSGYIEKLYVDYIGKPVQQGQALFEIYSPELVATQQEYLQAISYKKNMKQSHDSSAIAGADGLMQSAKRKLSLWDISSQQINQLEQTGEVKKTLTFYSPFSGVVIEKSVFEGMQVQAGMNLLKLAELSKMWVYADVYENELSFVKTGETANIELPYNAGQTLQGKVSYIYPFLQDQTRTAKVRIEITDINALLKKDMYVTVNIQPTVSINAIAVPEQSVIHSGKRDVVVLSLGNGKFKSVNVKLGTLSDNYYEVKEGLNEGDMIVTSSQFLIDSESNLQAGMSSMQGMNMGGIKNKNDTTMKDMKMK